MIDISHDQIDIFEGIEMVDGAVEHSVLGICGSFSVYAKNILPGTRAHPGMKRLRNPTVQIGHYVSWRLLTIQHL